MRSRSVFWTLLFFRVDPLSVRDADAVVCSPEAKHGSCVGELSIITTLVICVIPRKVAAVRYRLTLVPVQVERHTLRTVKPTYLSAGY